MSADKRKKFAAVPPDVASRIVAACKAAPGRRSLPGLVAYYLDIYQRTGEEFAPPAAPAGSEAAAEQLRAEFRALAAQQPQDRERPVSTGPPSAELARSASTPPALRPIWQAALATLQAALPAAEFDTWLRPAQLAGLDAGNATVTAPTADHASALQARYATPLRRALGDAAGRPLQVTITGP